MKALIPAAGLGTRWYPWSRILPKELLPCGNYPVIHHVLDEAVSAGITEIGIIISEAKMLIKTYVDEVWIADHPKIQLEWFNQATSRGVGDALLCAKNWVGQEPIAVLYPDEMHPKDGGMFQMCRAFLNHMCCWVGLMSKKQERVQAILAIEEIGDNSFRVHGLAGQQYDGLLAYGTGRYILANGFSHIGEVYLQALNKREKLEDSDIFAPLWSQDVRGILLSEPIFDVGDPDNWSLAVSSLFQKERFPS